MSELKVNKISPRSGTDVTLGDSGDTFTLGSGANIAGLTLSDNILFDTASKGIYLGVTSATASNLLDDYEEGTWTPEITPATGSFSSIVYDNTHGEYTKIGNMVYFVMFIRTTSASNFSGASGNITITGLPFTSSTVTSRAGGASFTDFNRWTDNGILDDAITLNAYIGSSSTEIVLRSTETASSSGSSFTVSNLRDTDATDNRIGLTGFYFTD